MISVILPENVYDALADNIDAATVISHFIGHIIDCERYGRTPSYIYWHENGKKFAANALGMTPERASAARDYLLEKKLIREVGRSKGRNAPLYWLAFDDYQIFIR